MSTELETLEVGFCVALAVEYGSAPLPVYIGEITALDEAGVRITLLDADTNEADGWDMFIPWEAISSAMVATKQHTNVQQFWKDARTYAAEMQAFWHGSNGSVS